MDHNDNVILAQLLSGPMTVQDLSKTTGLPNVTVHSTLIRLRQRGNITFGNTQGAQAELTESIKLQMLSAASTLGAPTPSPEKAPPAATAKPEPAPSAEKSGLNPGTLSSNARSVVHAMLRGARTEQDLTHAAGLNSEQLRIALQVLNGHGLVARKNVGSASPRPWHRLTPSGLAWAKQHQDQLQLPITRVDLTDAQHQVLQALQAGRSISQAIGSLVNLTVPQRRAFEDQLRELGLITEKGTITPLARIELGWRWRAPAPLQAAPLNEQDARKSVKWLDSAPPDAPQAPKKTQAPASAPAMTAAKTAPVTATPVTATPVTAAPVTAPPVKAAPVTAAPVKLNTTQRRILIALRDEPLTRAELRGPTQMFSPDIGQSAARLINLKMLSETNGKLKLTPTGQQAMKQELYSEQDLKIFSMYPTPIYRGGIIQQVIDLLNKGSVKWPVKNVSAGSARDSAAILAYTGMAQLKNGRLVPGNGVKNIISESLRPQTASDTDQRHPYALLKQHMTGKRPAEQTNDEPAYINVPARAKLGDTVALDVSKLDPTEWALLSTYLSESQSPEQRRRDLLIGLDIQGPSEAAALVASTQLTLNELYEVISHLEHRRLIKKTKLTIELTPAGKAAIRAEPPTPEERARVAAPGTPRNIRMRPSIASAITAAQRGPVHIETLGQSSITLRSAIQVLTGTGVAKLTGSILELTPYGQLHYGLGNWPRVPKDSQLAKAAIGDASSKPGQVTETPPAATADIAATQPVPASPAAVDVTSPPTPESITATSEPTPASPTGIPAAQLAAQERLGHPLLGERHGPWRLLRGAQPLGKHELERILVSAQVLGLSLSVE